MTRSRWVWVIGSASVLGCGQDLALPDGYGQPRGSGGAGPAEGVTGVAGVSGASGSISSAPVKDPATVAKGGSSASKGGAGAGGSATVEPSSGGEGGVAAGAGGEGGEVAAPPPELLFSEYVEGKNSDKALEIFALQGGSLEGCELHTFFNGKTEPTKLALSGQVATREVYVLCSTELGKVQQAPCTRSTSLSFNGDDALALVCQGVVQDIIGEIGVDPGDSWGMGATLDHTLQRRCEVMKGRTDPATSFVIDAEWVTFGVNTFSDLGQRNCEPLMGSTP